MKKSIVLNNDVKKGHIINMKDLNFKKPGIGLKPISYKKLLERKILKNLKKNTLLKYEHCK